MNKPRNKINIQNEYFTNKIKTYRNSGDKESIKVIQDKLASLGNRADQMEKKISAFKDRNLEIMHIEEEKGLRVKKNKRNVI